MTEYGRRKGLDADAAYLWTRHAADRALGAVQQSVGVEQMRRGQGATAAGALCMCRD